MNTTGSIDEASLFAPPPAQSSNRELGQEDFLTLMITQFRNQDPFKPMDNGDFLGQLAQFSTVSGIESLNSSFGGLSAALQNEQALQAANLVGHSVLARTEIGYLTEDGQIGGAAELASSAANVQIDITDASGQLVQRLNLGEQPPGTVRYQWDGRNLDGDLADEGHYRIETRVIRGTNVESAETLLEADIDSVTLGRAGEGLTLNLVGGEALPLSQVYQII